MSDLVPLSALEKVRAYVRRIHGHRSHVRAYTRGGGPHRYVAGGLVRRKADPATMAQRAQTAQEAAQKFSAANNLELKHLTGLPVRSPKQEARRIELLKLWFDKWSTGGLD